MSGEKVARELFTVRGLQYSDRYCTHAVSRMTMDQNPALRPRDDGWRRERTFINSAISITANQKHQNQMTDEAVVTLHDLFQSPASCCDHFTRYTYSVFTIIFMGFPIHSVADPFIREFEDLRARFMVGFRLDWFPSNVFSILGALPAWLNPSLSYIEALRKEHIEQAWSLRRKIEQNIRDGSSAGDSIYKHFLLNRDQYVITDEELIYTLQAPLGAGTHNPQDTVNTTLDLLTKFPEWQDKAHDEMERVVGKDRMPTFEDNPQLPILRAIITEGVRVRGVLREAGLPRKLRQDDIYGGYFF